MPRSDHAEGFQGYRLAQLEAGGRPEVVLSTMQGVYSAALYRYATDHATPLPGFDANLLESAFAPKK